MPVITPNCTSCKNFFENEKNSKFCCLAFQEGIPNDYFWCKIDVTIIKECNNGIGFEPIIPNANNKT